MMKNGQSLIELLLTISLMAILLPAILGGFYATRGGRATQNQRQHATAYLYEAQEALRVVFANGWSNISEGTYHPVLSGNTWVLVSGEELLENNYTRKIVIESVYRDGSGNMTPSGNLDPSTKFVTTSVSWSSPFPLSVTAESYMTRHKNQVRIETTVDDFTAGATNSATTGIAITSTGGGEIVLGASGGGGDWCEPSLALASLDLPKSGVANAISAIEGKVFAGTGENAAGVSFADVNITTDHPPIPTLGKTFDGYKTNDVFGEEGFAYLATDTNSKEIVAINLTEFSDPPGNTKYKEEGYFDAPGNGSGESVFVSGNYGYMTSSDKFYIFDLSSKSGSRPQVNPTAVTLSGTGVRVVVVGNYAFVATNNSSNQLQVIDVTNPASPTIVGQITVAGDGGRDLSVNETGTRVYLATEASSSKREFFIINTEAKNSPIQVTGGTYDTNGMNPKAVNIVTGNRAIVVGTSGTNQYQVVDITDENAPVNCGNLQIPTGVNGATSLLQTDGYAYSYIITGDATSELKIILGGAGAGGSFESTGIFESATFDAATESAWNKITGIVSVPPSTTLQYKIALKDPVVNSCTQAVFSDSDFVGSDGLSSSFFPYQGGSIPFDNNGSGYENPAQCMRYRAYLDSTDFSQSPVVYSVSFNYSP